jgi:hypothetical protein
MVAKTILLRDGPGEIVDINLMGHGNQRGIVLMAASSDSAAIRALAPRTPRVPTESD